ncbi:MAG TPA: hypothetical protein VK324_10170 [Tepidisphaeraceae bacterium]|nr:hypothetical protein [Tepidisphaeraceae bacterium]
MSTTPIDDSAKADSMRMDRGLRRLVCLPWPLLCRLGVWAKQRLARRRSPATARAADKQRQSEVRRELRGLPPVHDPAKPVP